MIIDSSYFTKGRRRILNATSSESRTVTAQNAAVNAAIKGFIEQYSPQFLNRTIGGKLAEDMLAEDGGDEKLSALFNDLKEAWADYIMYQILRYSGQCATVDGVVELKSTNTIISPAVYQANVWNAMVDELRIFCVKNPDISVDQCYLKKISSCWI